MSLRTKLFLGFLIPAVMWLVVGTWSSMKMRSLGNDVEEMLSDNDRSIQYSNRMLEEIEKIDKAILLKIGGDDGFYRTTFNAAAASFFNAEELAEGNITVKGEKELLDTLRQLQVIYFEKIGEVIATPNLRSYNSAVFPAFTNLRHRIQALGTLNSEAMYATAASVVDSARRAALPADLIVLAAIFFTFAFTWLVQLYVVSPLKKIVAGVKDWNQTEKLELPTIETGDEIQVLSEELNRINLKIQLRK